MQNNILLGEGDSDGIFMDAEGHDYHLAAGSPAIDRGVSDDTGPAPDYDLDGRARPLDGDGRAGAQWDIGAYEFGERGRMGTDASVERRPDDGGGGRGDPDDSDDDGNDPADGDGEGDGDPAVPTSAGAGAAVDGMAGGCSVAHGSAGGGNARILAGLLALAFMASRRRRV